jgi:hypothetical protein
VPKKGIPVKTIQSKARGGTARGGSRGIVDGNLKNLSALLKRRDASLHQTAATGLHGHAFSHLSCPVLKWPRDAGFEASSRGIRDGKPAIP